VGKGELYCNSATRDLDDVAGRQKQNQQQLELTHKIYIIIAETRRQVCTVG